MTGQRGAGPDGGHAARRGAGQADAAERRVASEPPAVPRATRRVITDTVCFVLIIERRRAPCWSCGESRERSAHQFSLSTVFAHECPCAQEMQARSQHLTLCHICRTRLRTPAASWTGTHAKKHLLDGRLGCLAATGRRAESSSLSAAPLAPLACARARATSLAVRTRAGWTSARGPSGARRARQLARARRARERASWPRIRARARLPEELRRELICSRASRSMHAAEERADGAPRSAQLGRSPRRRARPSRHASVR
jgi:hypothetical protein